MKTVLIIEDALIAQVILQRILASAGYEVAGVVSEGDHACEAFLSAKPDIVLLDLSIPGKDGLQVLKEIRAESPAAKIIICSAVRLDTKVQEVMRLGAQGYITKPIDSSELLSTLKSVLEEAA